MSTQKKILVLGDGDIGSALIDGLKEKEPNSKIISATRSLSASSDLNRCFKLDPLDETSWKNFIEKLKEEFDFIDLAISTYGILHTPDYFPEKSLKGINLKQMEENFKVNAFTAPLIAKYLLPFFQHKERSTLAFLSAKVGSISDNKIGGWYSYRASKVALNMFVKNISIEYERLKLNTSVLAIHPGTTHSKLSSPFIAKTSLKVWSPHQTASHILQVIMNSSLDDTGTFKNWDGEDISW